MIALTLLVALVGIFVFLIYSIINIAFNSKKAGDVSIESQNVIRSIPYKASFDEDQQVMEKANVVGPGNAYEKTTPASASASEEPPQAEPSALQTPDVVGQTPEELNAPEPLQERVSSKADSHSATDPYEKSENVALFGSNLRHPEASMERSSANYGALENEIVAGLASQVSKPTDLDKAQFSAEMAQNGGEFMNGIFAYDSLEGGSYFSSL